MFGIGRVRGRGVLPCREGRRPRQLPSDVASSHPAAVHLVREAIAHQTDMLDDQEMRS